MKKKFMLIAMILVFTLAMPMVASAATEADLIDNIKQSFSVDGQVKAVPAQYVAAVQKYLDANTLDSAQVDKLMDAVNDARTTWQDTGVLNFSQMSDADQKALIDKATAAAASVGAKLTFDGKAVKVVDPEGRTFALDLSSNVVQQTGYSSVLSIAVIGGLILLLAATFVFAGRKRLLSTVA
jgi:LPXTG-motif cell wall-anchored protein